MLPEDDAPPRGCAWFDSSHELMRGLVVLEFARDGEGAALTWVLR